MKNNTTPPLPPPNGWHLGTKSELDFLPHPNIKIINRLDVTSWENAGYSSGDSIPQDYQDRFWYAVRDEVLPPSIPDSGTRTNFSTGAVRDAAPGKGLPSRVPPCALDSLEKRFEDGAAKYNDDEHGPNWMKGIPLSRFFDAIQRHSRKAAQGHTDEDHFGAVLWNAAAWLWTYTEIEAGRLPAELNDLPFHPHGIFARNRK